MENIECPHCKALAISPKQKLKAGKFATIFCPNCEGRMCSNPTVLALLHFVLTWVILFFGYLAIKESSVNYAIMLVIGWLILEFFIYYIPLSRMRSLKPANSANDVNNNDNTG